MKCIINNELVNTEIIEDMGYRQGTGYVKEVIYNGKLYKVVSPTKKGVYREWTVYDRLG